MTGDEVVLTAQTPQELEAAIKEEDPENVATMRTPSVHERLLFANPYRRSCTLAAPGQVTCPAGPFTLEKYLSRSSQILFPICRTVVVSQR
jgi:hypothetical protein